MKKIKLISSLSALGAVSATVPVITSGCSQTQEAARLEINDATTTDAAIKYNENGTTELGHLIFDAYDKNDKIIRKAKINFTVEQKDRPDWIGNIHVNDGVITAKSTDTKPSTIEYWETSYYATCDNVKSASYPLTFYFIPAIDRSGVIYEKSTDVYAVANFTNFGAVTNEELAALANEEETVTVGSETIDKTKIYSLAIYGIASDVSTIPDNFCNGFTNLWYIDVNPLSTEKIQSIGQYFCHNCKSLTSVDLSVFTKLGSTQWESSKIGGGAFNCCDNLTYVNLGDLITADTFEADDEFYELYSFATTDEDAACFNPGITIAGKYASNVVEKFGYAESWWYGVYRNLIVA